MDENPDMTGAGWRASPEAEDRVPVGLGLAAPRAASGRGGGPGTRPGGAPAGAPEGRAADLEGRVALVTGAAGDLGAAFARVLSRRGARVCLLDADLGAVRRQAQLLGPDVRSLVLRCDLGSLDDLVSVAEFLRRSGQSLDYVIHAAGVRTSGSVTTSPVEVLDEHYLIGVRAPYVLNQQLSGLLSPSAQVVFVDRVADRPALAEDAHRTIVAAARRGLVQQLRQDLDRRLATVVSVQVDDAGPPDETARMALDAIADRNGVELVDLRLRAP